MIPWIKKAYAWITNNLKYILLVICSVILFVVCFSWYKKNKTIRKLEAQLVVLRAQVKLNKLLAKKDLLKEDIKELKKQESEIGHEIRQIEASLEKRLSEDLTAEEIADIFKRLGVL